MIDLIKSRVRDLLRTTSPEVIAIKGPWGVGKTHFWASTLKDLARQKALPLPKYAYVSLFGIGSLDQLKSQIFEQTVHTEYAAEGVTLNSVKENLREFAGTWEDANGSGRQRLREASKAFFRRGLSVAASIPQLQGYAALLRSGAFLLVRETLICIDDLERRGHGLSVRDVMGLVSYLKEQRNCKIVLIFNEGTLDSIASAEYAEYREKVVDIELEFTPTVRESLRLIFDEANPAFGHILDRATRLKLTNVRIIRKIKRTLDDLSPLLAELDESTVRDVQSSIILLSWAFFSRETGGPTLSFIQDIGATMTWRMDEDDRQQRPQAKQAQQMDEAAKKAQQEAERKQKWVETLKDYGWMYTDDLDQALGHHIERGYSNERELRELLQSKDAEYRDARGKEAIQAAWNDFHSSFDANQGKFVNLLERTFLQNLRYVARDQLNAAVSLLRELDEGDRANALVDSFIGENSDRPQIFTTESLFPDAQALDPYLRDRFFAVQGLNEKPMQVHEVVARIAENDSWGRTDEEFLASLTPDDIYEFLKGDRSLAVHRHIRVLLRFGEFGNSNEMQMNIATNTKKALKKIAAESKLNSVRVRRYNLGE